MIGSPARLLGHFQTEANLEFKIYEKQVFPENEMPNHPWIYFVATNHSGFLGLKFNSYDIMVDPWGMQNDWGQATVYRPGRNKGLPGSQISATKKLSNIFGRLSQGNSEVSLSIKSTSQER